MIERVLLLCAGRAERWGMHTGVRKHLVKINGEALLDRTLRLARQRAPGAGYVVVAFDSMYDRPSCERFAPTHGPTDFCDTDKLLSARERWAPAGQTVLLWGDVFFSKAAMAAILGYEGPARFFGRREGSLCTGCPWRELFALSFPASEQAAVATFMEAVRADLLANRLEKGGGWAVYERMFGGTLEGLTVIDDFTDDFDWPADYERWRRRYGNRAWRVVGPWCGRTVKSWRWRLARWRARLGGRPHASAKAAGKC